ncbi:MAG: ketopantoate reductase family protein [Candidatus Methylomirabilales bacterium]
MRTAILGAGGLGSVIGGFLAGAGVDVTLVGRSAHIEAIRTQGLRIDGREGTRMVRDLQVTTEPGSVGPIDLLIVCVKTYDTARALEGVTALRGTVRAVLSLQNGMRKDEILADVFGSEAVVGATTMEGATLKGPGCAAHTAPGVTYVGEYTGEPSARVRALVGMFQAAGLRIEAPPDIRAASWGKFVQVVAGSTVAVVTRLPYYQMYGTPRLATLFVEIARETGAVAEQKGITLVDLPALEARTLAKAPLEEALGLVQKRGRILRERGMTHLQASALTDIERGHQTEIDDLIGYVVREGQRLGARTRLCATLYPVVKGIEEAAVSSVHRRAEG